MISKFPLDNLSNGAYSHNYNIKDQSQGYQWGGSWEKGERGLEKVFLAAPHPLPPFPPWLDRRRPRVDFSHSLSWVFVWQRVQKERANFKLRKFAGLPGKSRPSSNTPSLAPGAPFSLLPLSHSLLRVQSAHFSDKICFCSMWRP